MVAASFHLFISQASAFRHKLSSENIFALSIVTALTACFFSIKKCAKMSAFYVKAAKIRERLGAMPPDPPIASGGLKFHLQTSHCAPLPLPNPGCATDAPSDNCLVKIYQ